MTVGNGRGPEYALADDVKALRRDMDKLNGALGRLTKRQKRIAAVLARTRAMREAHWARMEQVRTETTFVRTDVASILVKVTYNEELLEDVAYQGGDHEQRL